jgi:hypothetical protein
MMNKDFDYHNMSKPSNWNFNPTRKQFGTDWKGNSTDNQLQTVIPSNINDLLDKLKWMHLACVFLLFGSRISFFKNGTAVNFSSVMKIITVPLYFYMIFRVESTIRTLRTAYYVNPKLNGGKPDHFQFANWRSYKKSGGSTCFFENKHNAVFWLWIELYAFAGQILSVLFDLVLSYFSPTYVTEPKYPDYIFVKDYRKYDNKGQLMMSHNGTPTKSDHPKYYVFDANMTNVYS